MDLHVIIKGVDKHEEGRVLLMIEKYLREKGYPAEVYKETMADDSKVRNLMTLEKRKTL